MIQPRRFALAALAAAFLIPAPALGQQPAKAHETSIDGVTAEVAEASRKEGVLTMKVRYRNTTSEATRMQVYRDSGVGEYYVTAGSTKLMMLKDTRNAAVAYPHSIHGQTYVDIKPKGSFLFWAKYPAPPEDAKKVNFFHPHGAPVEDIPITDVK